MSPDTIPPSRVPFDLGIPPGVADPGRAAVDAAYRIPEAAAVLPLLDEARFAPDELQRVQALAQDLARKVRNARARSGGVDALMLEFSLDTEEGVALMCLAEALLRIPDAATRDRLIRDKLAGGEWRSHVGASPSLFVNAAAWGLLVTGHLMEEHADSRLEQALTSLLRRGGEPMIRGGVDFAMRLLGRQFVTGRTIEEALANAREREARGYTFAFDMLGEGAVTTDDAQRYGEAYERALHAIGAANAGRGVYAGSGISVKLSALHPRFTPTQRERVARELGPRVLLLARLAKEYDIGFNLDAEEADRLGLTLDVLAWLSGHPELRGWSGLGIAVQAYQKRARPLVDWLASLARRDGRRLNVRLVKGAYWDAEIKRAQAEGLVDYPVFTRKVHSDVAYLACARALLQARDAIYAQFGTHNAFTIAAVHAMAGDADCEFQLLHGMGEALYDHVLGPANLGRRCRVYAPVGSHATLLPYLVRRLLENGSNSSFVHRIVDPRVSIAELVADPVAQAQATGGSPHPRIALPRALFGDRINSLGLDFSDPAVLASLAVDLAATPAELDVAPVVAASHAAARRALDQRLLGGREPIEIRNPADRSDRVGTVAQSSLEDVQRAIALAVERGSSWAEVAVEARAACLDAAADRLHAATPQLLALLAREAGRTLPNAMNEVREAIDFCRYYAREARTELARGDASPRGPIVCISPWNFPLSIFVGQVAAALVTGNPVLAKPAEQTPLVASVAVALFHDAGVPPVALQYVPGRGETVGAALVADPRIAGVMFTGSTAVARAIHAQLVQRDDDPVLVAETGGQNAMIVDSSALAEQVVADAIASAFDSAGQRCSALRVLCLQEDIAPRVLTMVEGAMRELAVGDPRRLATDVGPVIDARGARPAAAPPGRDAQRRLSRGAGRSGGFRRGVDAESTRESTTPGQSLPPRSQRKRRRRAGASCSRRSSTSAASRTSIACARRSSARSCTSCAGGATSCPS